MAMGIGFPASVVPYPRHPSDVLLVSAVSCSEGTAAAAVATQRLSLGDPIGRGWLFIGLSNGICLGETIRGGGLFSWGPIRRANGIRLGKPIRGGGFLGRSTVFRT